jgi:DNA-binding XRE family transcriptional regulator
MQRTHFRAAPSEFIAGHCHTMLPARYSMAASKLLHNRISWFAAQAGLPDAAVAARAGVSRAHLNRIKNGRAVPRVGTAIALARALHVKVAQLYQLRRA